MDERRRYNDPIMPILWCTKINGPSREQKGWEDVMSDTIVYEEYHNGKYILQHLKSILNYTTVERVIVQ